MTNSNTADLLLFTIVNSVNILTFFLFISRMKWPNLVHKLAIASVVMAVPTIVVAVHNAIAGREWLYWVMPFIFIAWAVFALIFDIIRRIEFRQPKNPKILVPFLLLYYIGLIGMGVLTWRIGFIFWIITVFTFTLQLGGTAYAFRHRKG